MLNNETVKVLTVANLKRKRKKEIDKYVIAHIALYLKSSLGCYCPKVEYYKGIRDKLVG